MIINSHLPNPSIPRACRPEDAEAIRDHFKSASQAGDVMIIGGIFSLVGAVGTLGGLAEAAAGNVSWLAAAAAAAATSGCGAFTWLALRSARNEIAAAVSLNDETQCFSKDEMNALHQGMLR